MIIRKAIRDDIPEMAILLEELFTIEDDFTINRDKQITGLDLLLQNPHNIVLVAVVDEVIVGMVSMQQLVSTAMGGKVGVIEDLVVTEYYRGRGIGTHLLLNIISDAHSVGYARLALGADIRNHPALSFYTKHGFNQTHLFIFHKCID